IKILKTFFDSCAFVPSARNGKPSNCDKNLRLAMLFSPELVRALAEDFRDDTPRFYQCQSANYGNRSRQWWLRYPVHSRRNSLCYYGDSETIPSWIEELFWLHAY